MFYIYNILIVFIIIPYIRVYKNKLVLCYLLTNPPNAAMQDLFKIVLFYLKKKPNHLCEMKVDISTTLCLDLKLHRENKVHFLLSGKSCRIWIMLIHNRHVISNLPVFTVGKTNSTSHKHPLHCTYAPP